MNIELQDVKKAFNQGRPNELWAIRGVTATLEANRIICFKGASGSGKTTLLSMIGCLSRPTSGRIHLGTQMVSGLPERFMTQLRRSTFGFVFQKHNLIQGLNVLDNVMLPAYPLAPNHKTLVDSAHALLQRFSLSDKADNPVGWLSGGETQRVAICRALINDPQIIIADEPTANLDSALSQSFMAHMEALRASGKTVLITSHDPLVYDASCIDRVIEMRDGAIQ
jgi:putative ABC transport system ATP-binding protein